MQAALETALFAAMARAESKLLQLPSDQKERAIQSYLQIPVDEEPTVVTELRTILALLDCQRQMTPESDKPHCMAAQLYKDYQNVYSENFDNNLRISNCKLIESVRANVAKRKERGKNLATATHETPIWEDLNVEALAMLSVQDILFTCGVLIMGYSCHLVKMTGFNR
jgi:hypothetical protein